MKTNYIFILLILMSFTSFAQNKKFSVEANYPLAISNGFEDVNGIVDASIKYRFAEGELFKYGASFTFDYLKEKLPFNYQDLDKDYFFYHVNGFTEMTIPSAEKIHPFVGVGFTYVICKYEYFNSMDHLFDIAETEKEKNPGFNFKLGIQYDFTNSFFVQSYFHYIRSFYKSRFNNETIGINYNQVKFGIGFRF
ncbi:MAG: hypothetical protein CR985_03735 [Flavobacteriales bacterium]|nr:MAG: hypothetical protein CR985_03735 [Flavobacteriales bacterium]